MILGLKRTSLSYILAKHSQSQRERFLRQRYNLGITEAFLALETASEGPLLYS